MGCSQQSLPITIVVHSQHFHVESHKQTLDLPYTGSSQWVRFQVRPTLMGGSGRGTLRVYVSYKGNFIQAKEVEALIRPIAGEKSSGALTARRLFTTQNLIRPADIRLVPERVLTINVGSSEGSLVLDVMDRTEGDERIATYSNYLSSKALIGAVGGLRKHLKMMAGTGETIDGEEFIGYLLMGDEGNDKLLDQ